MGIGMGIVLDWKCSTVNVQRGKIVQSHDLHHNEKDSISVLNTNDQYKFLGKFENFSHLDMFKQRIPKATKRSMVLQYLHFEENQIPFSLSLSFGVDIPLISPDTFVTVFTKLRQWYSAACDNQWKHFSM